MMQLNIVAIFVISFVYLHIFARQSLYQPVGHTEFRSMLLAVERGFLRLQPDFFFLVLLPQRFKFLLEFQLLLPDQLVFHEFFPTFCYYFVTYCNRDEYAEIQSEKKKGKMLIKVIEK